VLLAFHPSLLQSTSTSGAKLPLAIYESVFEGENVSDADKTMQVDGEEQSLNIRFRELPYSVETGEAEMISVDFVARGGGNAMAVQAPATPTTTQTPAAGKKKRHAGAAEKADGEQRPQEAASALSPEDEDSRSDLYEDQYSWLTYFVSVIANLTTRLNAVKTLESRIRLIKSYLANLPPSFLDSSSSSQSESKDPATPSLSYPILRNISSLISGLSLVTPQDEESFAVESLAQENDVTLVSLLGLLGENVQHMRELGKKSAIVEAARQSMASSRKAALQSRFEQELREGAYPGGLHVP
jgi:COP9 signalosome complex subunit 6